MLVKRSSSCPEIGARDRTRLRELLHPQRDPARIRYSLALVRLAPGRSSLPHRLKQTEVYYLTRGRGTMRIDEEARQVKKGDAIYIPPSAVQWIENTGRTTLEFICIVDPAWLAEDDEPVTAGTRPRG